MRTGFAPIIIIFAIAVVIALSFVLMIPQASYIRNRIFGVNIMPHVDMSKITYRTPSPISSPDETANWKTYTNEKFRYSIQYPPNLKLIVNNNRSSITNNNNDTKHYFNISIEASDNTKNQTAQDFVSSSKILTASGEYKNPFITPKPYTKGSLNGVISDVTNGDDFYLEVIQTNDEKIYEFKLLSGPDTGTKPTAEDRTIFDQILSTFKFLD